MCFLELGLICRQIVVLKLPLGVWELEIINEDVVHLLVIWLIGRHVVPVELSMGSGGGE